MIIISSLSAFGLLPLQTAEVSKTINVNHLYADTNTKVNMPAYYVLRLMAICCSGKCYHSHTTLSRVKFRVRRVRILIHLPVPFTRLPLPE